MQFMRKTEIKSVVPKNRITLPTSVDGKFVDGGHWDMGAYTLNTGINLTRPNRLRERHLVQGTQDYQSLQVDVPSSIGRVKTFMGAAFVSPIRNGEFAMPTAQEFLTEHARHDQVYADIAASNDSIKPVRTVEDLWFDTLHNKEAMGMMKSVEGLYVDGENYREVIDTLKDRGIVSVGLMWNFDSSVGCTTKPSVRDEKEDTGLTELGHKVVEYLDERDMIIDLSHASDRTVTDVLKIKSKNPRIFTHSGSREIQNHNRNVTDEIARAIIDGGTITLDGEQVEVTGGGVIGIPFIGAFIGPEGERNVDQVAEHVKHFKEIGLLHGIMIGSDFDGASDGNEIEGLEDVTVVHENLTQALLNKDFTQEEVDMVLYGNALDFWLKNLSSENPPAPSEVVEEVVYTA